MGAFFSLRKTVGYMILAAAASYAVMRLHSVYLGAYPDGRYSEIFFALQTILLIVQCILGLMLVGVSIFYSPSGAGIICTLQKLFLILIMSALAFFGIWLVAGFCSANASALMMIMNT